MPRIKEMEGKIFGRLVVVKFYSTNKRNQALWECLCSCGNTTVVNGVELRRGDTRSCGCLWKEVRQLPKGEAGFNTVYRDYKNGAKNRSIFFDNSEEFKQHFRKLTKENCFYCGIEPKQTKSAVANKSSKNGIEHSRYIYNGIDRLDNDKKIGYRIENTTACCGKCNKMKDTSSKEDFLDKIKRIKNNLNL